VKGCLGKGLNSGDKLIGGVKIHASLLVTVDGHRGFSVSSAKG
jgi:hypothetical protein